MYVHIYIHICMLTYTEIRVYIHNGRSTSGHILYLCKEFWINLILQKWNNKRIFFPALHIVTTDVLSQCLCSLLHMHPTPADFNCISGSDYTPDVFLLPLHSLFCILSSFLHLCKRLKVNEVIRLVKESKMSCRPNEFQVLSHYHNPYASCFPPQLLKVFGTVLNKLEEIHTMNIKNHFYLTCDELFTVNCTSVDGQLSSAIDLSL